MQKATLTHWTYSKDKSQLIGIVKGHPLYDDGMAIRTTSLGYMDPLERGAVTSSMAYDLGIKLPCEDSVFKEWKAQREKRAHKEKVLKDFRQLIEDFAEQLFEQTEPAVIEVTVIIL